MSDANESLMVAALTAWADATAMPLEQRQQKVLQVDIDGVMYTMQKPTTSIGLALGPRIFAIMGSSFVTGQLDIVGIFDRLPHEDVPAFAKQILAGVQAGGSTNGPVVPKFDEHFGSDYAHLLRVLIFTIVHAFKGPTRGVH